MKKYKLKVYEENLTALLNNEIDYVCIDVRVTKGELGSLIFKFPTLMFDSLSMVGQIVVTRR